jgi:hypothetical protein
MIIAYKSRRRLFGSFNWVHRAVLDRSGQYRFLAWGIERFVPNRTMWFIPIWPSFKVPKVKA